VFTSSYRFDARIGIGSPLVFRFHRAEIASLFL
jgi:hypothetical protein